MALKKLYSLIGWKNKPNLSTPLGATNLSKMDTAIDGLDDRVIELNETVTSLANQTGSNTSGISVLTSKVNEHTTKISALETTADEHTASIDALKIIPTASGNTVYIIDASNMNFENIDIYGESTQMQTTGKNLANCSGLTEQTKVGVTFTPVYKNGYLLYININGTSTSSSWTFNLGSVTLPAGKAYTLSGCPSGGSESTFRLQFNPIGVDYGNGATSDVLTEDVTASLLISIQSNKTFNNLKFYPMIRDASITDATYEPYTGGVASPSPDYPQPIESKVVNRVDVLRKNLLDCSGLTEQTIRGVTFTPVFENGLLKYINVNGTNDGTYQSAYNLPYSYISGKYILSGCADDGGISTFYLGVEVDGVWASENYVYGSQEREITVKEKIMPAIVIKANYTANNLKFYPMIRLASITDGTYEPYQSQTVFIPNLELNGIGGVRDTDKLKKFGVVVFDGSDDEGWYAMTTRTSEKYRIYTRNYPVKNADTIYSVANILCSHYKPTSSSQTYNENVGIAVEAGNHYIYIYDENFNTADVSLWKAHLQANPMTVVYELAEPTETSLPQVDIDAIKQLHTYKPNTVVMNDADAEMDVSYVADTKLYIDQKFETLASAIVNQ